MYVYILLPAPGVKHSREEIIGRHLHNAKYVLSIEHSAAIKRIFKTKRKVTYMR